MKLGSSTGIKSHGEMSWTLGLGFIASKSNVGLYKTMLLRLSQYPDKIKSIFKILYSNRFPLRGL